MFDGSIISKNESCQEGKKNCGIIDSIENILCIDKDEDCPINYVAFSKNRPNGIKNLRQINGTDINFYFTNNPYENTSEIKYIAGNFIIAESKIIKNMFFT